MSDELGRRLAALAVVALAAVGAALWGAIAGIESFRRGSQTIREARELVCLAHTGRPGPCTCAPEREESP
jgi:hypothetical protein